MNWNNSDEPKSYRRITINFVFLMATFIVIILSAITDFKFYRLIRANRWVEHTYQVILAANSSLYHLISLESRQRGYFLFADEVYIPSYTENVLKIKQSLISLALLTVDNAAQHEKAQRLSALATAKIDVLSQLFQVNKKSKLSSAEGIILFQKSQSLTNEIRALTNEIVQSESLLLKERNANALENITITKYVFIIGQLISIISLLIAFTLFNRELLKRWLADTERKNIESQLRSIIEGASDMIAALDLNLRYIIFNHAYEREFQRLFDKQISIGMSLNEALAHVPESKHRLIDSWKESLSGKEYVQNMEFNIDNQQKIYEITSSLIKNNKAEILGAVHIVRNITERMKNQKDLKDGLLELKDKNEKITILLEMSDVLLACNSIEELSEIIAKYSSKVLSFSNGIFYIMHHTNNNLEISATWGTPSSHTKSFTQEQCWALRLGHIHHAGLSNTELTCNHVVNTNQKEMSYLCVPLRAQNDIYGVLYVEVMKTESKQQLTSNESLLVSAFAELAALALANVRLRENLSYQSIHDPLTALYNRRYLEEYLLKQISQSERTKKSLAVLMLDADHFKQINDMYGHDTGDLVLKEIAQILLKEIRPGDLASRYGGEEFVVVLYDTDLGVAFKRADDLRKSISLLNVKFGAQEAGKITISTGIAIYPQDGSTPIDLIEAADKALYAAKHTGKNKVSLFAEI